ncbi:unnamed protein product [Ectocarpus sp. 6 AP-2014]
MRVLVASVVGTAFLLGAEDCRVITEAFAHPPVPRAGASGRGTAGNNRGLAVIRRRAPAGFFRSGMAVSSSRSEGGAGEEGQRRRPTHRACSGGDRDLQGAAPPHRSPRAAAAAAAAAALTPLRQTAATALAAVLMLASTEQDIMTAMMGLDPSLATSTAAQPAMTLLKEEGPQAKGGKAPSMGSIDVQGQGDALGEIAGGPGGGFKNGRLMVDQDSDLAMMLGKKMKTPDADPLTH